MLTQDQQVHTLGIQHALDELLGRIRKARADGLRVEISIDNPPLGESEVAAAATIYRSEQTS